MKQWTLGADQDGQRFDKYLKHTFAAAPLSLIFRLLRTKKIKLNGKRAEPGARLADGDSVTIYFNDEELARLIKASQEKRDSSVQMVRPTFQVLFEDEDLLVINKPAGVPSHSGTGTGNNTVINQALTYLGYAGDGFKPALIHRLDKDTSGTLLIGKNRKAVAALGEEMAQHGFRKEYLALVDGQLKEQQGTIKNIIAKSSAPQRTMRSTLDAEEGKEAITRYRVQESFADAGVSLLRLQLLTGRTHQIRTHMAELGHPLLGDTRYGNFQRNRDFARAYKLGRHFLHAETVVFHHPRTGKQMMVTAPLPPDLSRTLDLLHDGKN